MEPMPRPRPPHLQRQVTRHGKAVWYVRMGKGRRTRIRATFGTPDFDAEYHAAITARPRPPSSNVAADTLAWLIERYRETRVARFIIFDATAARSHPSAHHRVRR
jgi:hypothetical protein